MELETINKMMRLVAGHGGLKNRITYVTIAEAPDFYEWVSGGEFVLSTLYAFKDHPELRAPAYRALAKSGVAAIGIKTKRFFDEIPADIIEIANEYNLPVFEIRRETWFREAIQAISAELNNEQTNVLIEVERHYQELTKVALIGGDFDEFIRGFGRRLRRNVICLRSDYKVLGEYSNGPAVAAGLIGEKIEQQRLRQGEIVQYSFDEEMHVFPCVTKNHPLGYLVVPDAESLNEKSMLMANQLTTFLTLKLIDQLETEQKMLTALLDDILFKRNLSEEELRERLALHGLQHKNLYRVICLRQCQGNSTAGTAAAFRIVGDSLKKVLIEALVIMRPDEVIIITTDQQEDADKPPVWTRKIGAETLQGSFPVAIGVGPAVVNASEIHSSYHMAKSTAKAGSVFGEEGVIYYRDYLARLLLMRSVDTAEQKYLLAMIIAPLQAHDARHNSQLIATVGALIFADEMETAAASLYVHINTVRYRLSKIKQLTGYDFLTAKGCYVITTAYLMYCCKP